MVEILRVRVREGLLAGAIVTVTPHVLEACRNPGWNEALTDQLIHETLARVAGAYRPGWSERYRADRRRWLEGEARVEAACLVRDTTEFLRALIAYEDFALSTFAAWARGEERR